MDSYPMRATLTNRLLLLLAVLATLTLLSSL